MICIEDFRNDFQYLWFLKYISNQNNLYLDRNIKYKYYKYKRNTRLRFKMKYF